MAQDPMTQKPAPEGEQTTEQTTGKSLYQTGNVWES